MLIDYAFGIGATIISIIFLLSVVDREKLMQRGEHDEHEGPGYVRYRNKTGKKPVCALVLLGVLLSFLGFQIWKMRKDGWLPPPNSDKSIAIYVPSAAERRTNPVFADLHGFAIWSSNRFGNHDLVMLTLPELELTRLTTDPHPEYFPRISPDGTKVLFCRSQVLGNYQKNTSAWDTRDTRDTWLLELATGTTRLLARNADTPTWSADGEKVYFVRQANQFVEYTLANQKELVVFETGKNHPLNTSIEIETPVWSEARQALAVTLRGGARGTFVINQDKSLQQVGKGCELNWALDSSFLYFVDHTKGGDNAFFTVNPDTLEKKLWFDAPGAFSHEYFPKISNTGDMLIFGASTGGHEHDKADYEIFLWPIGTPMGNTARLSFHTGNDNWPDIFLY
ncbi:MAG: hypothetical protein D3906_15170 [Candidatus Electrothrix sp. AUS1_2]|nr:hypothetical protein [Candidatus Electrothrix sp. AUS1_2]